MASARATAAAESSDASPSTPVVGELGRRLAGCRPEELPTAPGEGDCWIRTATPEGEIKPVYSISPSTLELLKGINADTKKRFKVPLATWAPRAEIGVAGVPLHPVPEGFECVVDIVHGGIGKLVPLAATPAAAAAAVAADPSSSPPPPTPTPPSQTTSSQSDAGCQPTETREDPPSS